MFTKPRNFYPVVGRTDGIFERLPVEELKATQPYQWTLFVLGYAWIQGKPIPFPGVVQPPLTPAASLMEVGGIHGKPYREYSGDGRPPAEASSDFDYLDKKDTNPVLSRFGGYCNHASVTFPTWHRPYVMLIEQAIGDYATNVAEQIERTASEAGLWVPAAKQLRFPYWDWADPKVQHNGLPSLFYSNDLPIVAPGKKTVTVPNPLSSFKFPYIPEDFQNVTRGGATAYFQEWPQTYRHAASSPTPGGSNIPELQAELKAKAKSLRESIGLLFTLPDRGDSSTMYDEFSNTRNESRRIMDYSNSGSLEGVHNAIHGIIGGNGHMGNPDYAGFDPIFYFHHSNVDRLLALWEWCYTRYWMNDGYTHGNQKYPWTQSRGTFAQVYNAALEPTGDNGTLAPFRHIDGTYWTNEQTRFLTKHSYPKYYSYKEFQGVKVDKPATNAMQQRVARAKIAKYYGIDPRHSKRHTRAPSWTHIPVPGTDEVEIPQNFKFIAGYRHFVVLVRLPEHAFGHSYHFELYYNVTQLVGSTTVFTREDSSPCAACASRRASASIVRGVIYVPPNIVDEIIEDKIRSPEKAMENAANLITKSFQGRLVDLSGKVLASALGGEDVGMVPATDAAVDSAQPVEITLFSAAVAEHVNDEEPVQFLDWKPHNGLFPSGWKALADEAK
ncbi:Di-copper centre-containing protein [Paxillus ammoniavirescens]|nr:Di-copper centre-containing protein [Paxillus ammoniavirescens]